MNRGTGAPIIFLILMIGVSMSVFLNPPLYMMIIMLTLYVTFFFGFSFTHGFQTIGGKAISVLFGVTALVTYVMEWLGTHYGIPFGHYYYTNQLGPLILDVPVVIPVQWFNVLYVCYLMTNIILTRSDDSVDEAEISNFSLMVPRMIVTSVITGLFMVSWDLINDPYMVGLGSWVWTDPTEFLGLSLDGIPLSNFLGWFLTSVLTVLLFDLYRYKARMPIQSTSEKVTDTMNGLVLVPYLYLFIFQTTHGIAAGVLSFGSLPVWLAMVTMGLAIIVTGWRYSQHRGKGG
ncbi:MAG: carotenoid biosynthesis protein [Candidatus Thorarchaeota archaeon]